MSEHAANEGIRIVRTIRAEFPSGGPKAGSAFALEPGFVVTCAHVVKNDRGEEASTVTIRQPDGEAKDARVKKVSDAYDLALLESPSEKESIEVSSTLPVLGRRVIFAGMPQGVAVPSLFPGMVSAVGSALLKAPRCDLIQIAGMINNGNSGGPLLDGDSGQLLGIVTAKYVPLLQEIDKMVEAFEQIPQMPSSVGIQDVDFGKFVNVTIRSLWQVAAVLRLVQVGTGWAVPAKYLSRLGA